ncbi:hypothetical protein F0919_03620 [Taibaiella lutea]|uniref:DUF4252 domain-containing protein n=1 Tax=Taibaiella lutea TaxID=2608001 RepID=A0A5M6CNI5_9BACT|nr:hypothetical protein [Taibaiella lutea]KAA5536771.1 hypothetical protein F0919_03620 [Taibaiella lutea]
MKHLLFLLCFSLCIGVCNTHAQQSSTNIFSTEIKSQGEEMARLFLKKDYKTFSAYTYPKIKEMMGGEQGEVKALTELMGNMEADGFAMLSLKIGEPHAIIKQGDELQCVVPQTIEMNTPKGKIVSETYLIAISMDNGKKWFFIDTSTTDIDEMRKVLTNLSKELIIPEKKKTLIND